MWGEGGEKVNLIEIQDIWWPPVMQSGRSRGTYGKIRDCEPSAKTKKYNAIIRERSTVIGKKNKQTKNNNNNNKQLEMFKD